jgi:hypothetical protein
MDQIIDMEEYERKKDEGILSIGKEKADKWRDEYNKLTFGFLKLKYPITLNSHSDLCKYILDKDTNFMTRIKDRAIEKGVIHKENSSFLLITDIQSNNGIPLLNENVVIKDSPLVQNVVINNS